MVSTLGRSGYRTRCDRRWIQTPAGRDQCDQQIFTGGDKPRKRRRAAQSACPPRRRADRRDMHELHQRPTAARGLQRAPIGVIAKICPGIARQTGGQRGSLQRVEEAREGRASRQCALTRFDDCTVRTPTADIGEQDRARIARPRLDANLSPAAGKAEDQQHVRPPRQKFGQIAVHRIVSRRKNVACDFNSGERRAAPARQRSCQMAARV